MDMVGIHSGLISPLLFIIAAGSAILMYPGYNPAYNYLSELGTNPHTCLLFNSGVLLSGLFGILFAGFLMGSMPAGFARSGAFLLGAGLLFFSMIAFFTLDSPLLHIFFAGMFFALMILSFILTGLGLVGADKRLARFSSIMGAIVLALPLSGFNPLAEHIAVGAMLLWSIVMWQALREPREEYEWLWSWSYY
jgi:hypothetical membrane protein